MQQGEYQCKAEQSDTIDKTNNEESIEQSTGQTAESLEQEAPKQTISV